MVPDKFDMVDMGGIDLIESQGLAVDGLYQKLVESITLCRYQCLYNWKFNGIVIPPSYVEMELLNDEVWINEGVSVDEEDVIHIYSIEPEPPAPIQPTIQSLQVTENGLYQAPEGVDGYNPVNVNIASGSSMLLLDREPTASDGNVGDYCIASTELIPDGVAVKITAVARGTDVNFTYWGFPALRFVFEDSNEVEVDITELQNYVVWLSPTNPTNNTSPQNQLLTNPVSGAYIERNGLPGFIVAKADGLSGHKLKSFSACRRQGTSYVDYMVSFEIYWFANNSLIGVPFYSVSGLSQNDWPNGEFVTFDVNSQAPVDSKLYYKEESGWVLITEWI